LDAIRRVLSLESRKRDRRSKGLRRKTTKTTTEQTTRQHLAVNDDDVTFLSQHSLEYFSGTGWQGTGFRV